MAIRVLHGTDFFKEFRRGQCQDDMKFHQNPIDGSSEDDFANRERTDNIYYIYKNIKYI